ncbi:MAG TPA: TIGR04063 family PEP-CTERM/XrtA system glycosyltransferase [Burkholderiales bacterium]|nr:TIGR04063 family PEP-CTERM/XrtA system glycosyltransferase [Burkholderiales bacterium]
MRVIHILDHSVPLQSGYAFRTLAILKEQRALGWETFHLTGPKQGPVHAPEEQVNGWHFYRTPPPGGILEGVPGLGEIELMGEISYRIEQVARRVRPHLLHAHSPILNAIPALRVGRRLGIPVVYELRALWEDAAVNHGTVREGGLRYRLSRGLESWVLRRVDAITTICEGLRGDILARNIPAGKITVVPNAVDVEEFQTGAASDPALKASLGLDGARVLGFIGSFYAYEGLAVLLHALRPLLAQDPTVRVLLVGGGRQEAELKQLAATLGVAGQVVFAGRVPHGQIQRYYDLVDLLVYPRLSMRLTELVTPLKPLEAMAQGRLLIASDVGGHRELIRHGETGMLFKAGDPQALAAAVIELLQRPERWPALKANARAFVENERNWRSSVSRYRSVYAGLIKEGEA